MRPTELLQEIRIMRFEETFDGWVAGRLATGSSLQKDV
jgi:hypothetical protein